MATSGIIWTYALVEDECRLRSNAISNWRLTPTVALDIISQSVDKIAKELIESGNEHYVETKTGLAIASYANSFNTVASYSIDISAVSPYPHKILSLLVTNAGDATDYRWINLQDTKSSLDLVAFMPNIFVNALGVREGQAIYIYAGTNFTIDVTASTVDTAMIKYLRQPIIASASRSTKVDVPDTHIGFLLDEVTKRFLEQTTEMKVA